MKNWIFILALAILVVACKNDKKNTEKKFATTINVNCKPVYLYGYNLDFYNVVNDTVRKNETFGTILDRHHIPYSKVNEIASKIKDTFDVRSIRLSKPYTILTSKDSTNSAKVFIYKNSLITSTVVDFKDSIISAYKHREPIKVVRRNVSGEILTNFSKAIDTLGLSAGFSYEIAEIYSSTVDFYRLQKGDTFKVIFEQKYINDTVPVGYGDVKAMVFNHGGKNLYSYRYISDTIAKTPNYFDEKAGLMKRQFLKSPIKFQFRISSKFNLHRRIALYGNKVRPHKGTDFAAAYGTPIMSTATGVVVESARRGGNGNYVKVKHDNVYTTQYLHMKRRKVKVGNRVKQGDIIGWVGMTGNTSGPHVCYRFWKNGRQVDPFKLNLPVSKPMKKELKPAFFKFIKPLKEELDKIPSPNKQEEKVVSNQ